MQGAFYFIQNEMVRNVFLLKDVIPVLINTSRPTYQTIAEMLNSTRGYISNLYNDNKKEFKSIDEPTLLFRSTLLSLIHYLLLLLCY